MYIIYQFYCCAVGIHSPDSRPIRGFMVKVVDGYNRDIGQFSLDNQIKFICGSQRPAAVITHVNSVAKYLLNFVWTADTTMTSRTTYYVRFDNCYNLALSAVRLFVFIYLFILINTKNRAADKVAIT